MRHFPDLSCLVVDLSCFSNVRSLASWYAFLLFFFLRHASTSWQTLYLSLFCHLQLCPDLSVNLSIVFGSFWLASLFLHVSGVTQGFLFRRWLPRSSAAVSVTALQLVTHLIIYVLIRLLSSLPNPQKIIRFNKYYVRNIWHYTTPSSFEAISFLQKKPSILIETLCTM